MLLKLKLTVLNRCTKKRKTTILLFHRTKKDTAKWNVSRFGHYVSVGIGPGQADGLGGLAIGASYSFAYKSHLVTFSYNYSGVADQGNSTNPTYSARSFGLLIGESVRYKHLFVSLSAGAAFTNMYVYDPSYDIYLVRSGIVYSTSGRITVPIELKFFYVARNGIGAGIHLTENIVSQPSYSPFSFCFSIVTGFWNKQKK